MTGGRKATAYGLGALAIGLLLVFPFAYTASDYNYLMHVWITAFFYAILASSWSLLSGYAGQFSFGHMAFMAIGAYTAGLFHNYVYVTSAPTGLCWEVAVGDWFLVVLDPIGLKAIPVTCLDKARATWPAGVEILRPSAWMSLPLAALTGGVAGFLIGVLVLRLRAAYLALFTVGFSEILRATISAEIPITRGQAGMALPPILPDGVTLFGTYYAPTDKLPAYYIMLTLFLVCLALMGWLERSRFGIFIRSLREDEEAAAALGVNVVRYKVLVFVFTSIMASVAGALQAHYVSFITPNILVLLQMSLVIAMAVIGGLESIVGAAIGAVAVHFALELLRESFTIGGITVDMTVWRMAFFGLLLMLTLRFWRNGLIYPILQRLTRAGVAEETVAGRLAREDDEQAGSRRPSPGAVP